MEDRPRDALAKLWGHRRMEKGDRHVLEQKVNECATEDTTVGCVGLSWRVCGSGYEGPTWSKGTSMSRSVFVLEIPVDITKIWEAGATH